MNQGRNVFRIVDHSDGIDGRILSDIDGAVAKGDGRRNVLVLQVVASDVLNGLASR